MFTLASPAGHESIVKKSRFIVRAASVTSADDAMAFVDRVREGDATHNCWAYKIGPQYRFSDDGEPGGTAGRPILAAIESQQLDHVAVVVTRYFGGIKLGAGGLARAYGGAAAECLRLAERVEVRPTVRKLMRAPFDCLGAVHTVLDRLGVVKRDERFEPAGVVLTLEVDVARLPDLVDALRDATRGAVTLTTPTEPDQSRR